MYSSSEDKWLYVFLSKIAAIVAIMIGAIIGVVLRQNSLSDQFISGQINLGQYCDLMTDNGTDSNDIPVKCYQYYNVQRVGTKCHLVGKIEQCDPILAPN